MKEREESREVKAKDEGGIVGVNRERRQRVHKIREIWIVMNVARGGEGWRTSCRLQCEVSEVRNRRRDLLQRFR